MIFENLDLPDLIYKAEVSKKLSHVFADVFRRKYLKNRTLRLNNPFLSCGVDYPMDKYSIYINDDEFSITDYAPALKVLKHFGHVIKKLAFQCNTLLESRFPAMIEIIQHVNTYCSDSLIELKILTHVDIFFPTIFKPFPSVESVSIRGDCKSYDSPTLRMEQIFPAIRNLRIGFDKVDGNAIDRRFVNLENLHAFIWSGGDGIRKEHVEAMVRKNPQIKRIGLEYGPRSLLKFINQHLPNLDELYIESCSNDSEDVSPIVFENVEIFTVISWDSERVPENIHFPNLVEFNANSFAGHSEKWIDIVHNTTRDSSKFKKLKVWKDGYDKKHLSNGQLDKLAERELNLDEIRIKLGQDVTDDTILKFVAINQNTKIIHLSRDNPENSFQNVIRIIWENFGDEWKINNSEIWRDSWMVTT